VGLADDYWFAETQMKMPDIYHNWRAVFGIALILLGSGNWFVGRLNTQRYGELIRSAGSIAPDQAYRSFDELDAGAAAVLAPLTAEQRRVSYATARMDFYHATFLTGYVLVLAGLLLTFLGFLDLIRNDAWRATVRVTGQISRTPDKRLRTPGEG
jgi:multisubunit Na+/H+ antiporter MnhG subunit